MVVLGTGWTEKRADEVLLLFFDQVMLPAKISYLLAVFVCLSDGLGLRSSDNCLRVYGHVQSSSRSLGNGCISDAQIIT